MEKEKRCYDLELRESKTGAIEGYAAVFNSDSADMGFTERIKPGAFKGALRRSKDTVALFNHDMNEIFGRRGVNLKLKEDKHGLWMETTPIDTPTYSKVAANIRSGIVTSQSFSFTVAKDEWADLDSESPKRTILEIGELFDVGPVVSPAYQDTTVAQRSLEAAREIPPEAEETTVDEPDQIVVTVSGKEYKLQCDERADGPGKIEHEATPLEQKVDSGAPETLEDILKGI